MANLIKTYSWNFNIATGPDYIQEDVKLNISRWVNDSTNFGFGWGHFSTPIEHSKIISGVRVKIDNQFHFLYTIKTTGNILGDIRLYTNPVLGRVNHIYGTQIDNQGAKLCHLNIDSIYTGDSFLETLYGIGSDGDVEIDNTVQINKYYQLEGILTGGQKVANLDSTIGLNVDDEILFLQTQDKTAVRAGLYEFNRITKIIGNKIYLKYSVGMTFITNSFNGLYNQNCQVIKVPNYNNLTIKSSGKIIPKLWDGYTGGFVVFRVKNKLINNGIIDLTGYGFRGGVGIRVFRYGASDPISGEGIFGINTLSGDDEWRKRGPVIGIGGGGSTGGWWYSVSGCGGGFGESGGGAHGGSNQYGEYNPGGTSIFTPLLLNISLGCGGGGWGGNGDPGILAKTGGRGSGSCIICSNHFINNNSILCKGGRGINDRGGGGSGGGIILYSEQFEHYGLIDTSGHPRTYYVSSSEYSGAGGRGRVVIFTRSYKNSSNTKTYYATFHNSTTIREFVQIGLLPLDFTIPINVYYYISSNDNSKILIKGLSRLENINISHTFPIIPEGSDIRTVISFDSRKTFVSWINNRWTFVTIDEVPSKGMTLNTLHNLNANHFLSLNGFNKDVQTLDFIISIKTGYKFDSPKITKIDVTGSERSWRPFGIKVPRQINTVNIGKVLKFMTQP